VSEGCVFCQIIRGERPAHVVHQDERTFAFLDHSPLLLGHTLVLLREHVATLDDLSDEQIAILFVAVRRMSIAVQRGLGAEGSLVVTNTRISQSVPHVHVHVVPRRKGDGLFSQKMLWTRLKYESEAQAEEIATKIRAAYVEAEQREVSRVR
jgi:histidine triad (HIT) family protein